MPVAKLFYKSRRSERYEALCSSFDRLYPVIPSEMAGKIKITYRRKVKMKRLMIWAMAVMFLFSTAAFAQDKPAAAVADKPAAADEKKVEKKEKKKVKKAKKAKKEKKEKAEKKAEEKAPETK